MLYSWPGLSLVNGPKCITGDHDGWFKLVSINHWSWESLADANHD